MNTSVIEFNQFESDLAEYKSKYENVVYDMTVPTQEKQARSDRLSIGKKVAELDRVHAAVKAPLKAQVDLLDGERKRIKDGLLLIQGNIKSQIEEHEAALQAIEDALADRVEAIKSLAEFEAKPTSDFVRERMEKLNAIEIDDSFANHEANAALAHRKSLESLTALLAETEKSEAEAAELERLRKESAAREQAEREARIALEAENKAKQEAADAVAKAEEARIKAENDARDAAARAKQEAIEAAGRAEREKAEAVAKAEAEAKAKAEQLERERLAAEEKERKEVERREANKKHCATINNAAADALVRECELTSADAKAVIVAIAKGLIPSTSIKY